jgi:hypothetical protein
MRGEQHEEQRREKILGCPLVKFPLRYLGLQLILHPLTRSQWHPVVDKVMDFLPAWPRGLIAREGQLLLIKTVEAAKPIHQLLVAEAPIWVLDEIGKWQRFFFRLQNNK